ncbi:response regulator transcription factor [Gracilibacillus salinarum]|uniref:Response regulator n=1 Tax=Gracilibacillus salinarum TaxID=2932255 RepID=A0ABY4GHB1_9BACI|nr:response regulator [Gracilibacillus salinarum]UOQ83726.1 response regulator [Gracilibacillus salinarum]
MTLKMLIVDDEPLICKGLANTIPWEQMNMEVIGTAMNGKKALEIMKKQQVDIVITDVYMPEMDGIELSKAIVDDFPEVTIIMISGYDEFEYARQALRIGVQDYLLKPVDIDELLALVQQIQQQIEETRIKEQAKQETVLTNYLSQQLFQLPDPSNLSEKIDSRAYAYRILLIEKRNYDHDADWATDQIKRLTDYSSICIETHENQLLLFLYGQEDIAEVNSLTSAIMAAFDQGISVAVSSAYQDLHQFASLYQELHARLSFYRGTDRQLITDAEDLPAEQDYELNQQLVCKIADAVFQQEQDETEAKVGQLFTEFEQKAITLRQIKEACCCLLESIKERGQDSSFAEIELGLHEELDLLLYNSVEAIRSLLIEDLERMIDYLKRTNDSHWIIQQAKQYIEKNFQKDVKALEVAEAHYITPNYFSMLFKQETGSSYSEYLNTIRINKAKALLTETSNKVFEIAEYVGYREYKYFVQVFKNYVGITPTQFRKLHSIEK